jgi:hypothetical protein
MTPRKPAATAPCTSSLVSASPARARLTAASALIIPARRRPKSTASHEKSAPAVLPQTLSLEAADSTGPEIDGIVDCGSSSPNTLFAVARFVCHTASRRGRYAARATSRPALDAFTCSSAARTVG